MCPIADNRNLSGDKPVNAQNLEQANQPVRHDQPKSDARPGFEPAGSQPGSVPGAPASADPFAPPNTSSSQTNDSPDPKNTAPSAPPNTEARQSIFSRLTRPKGAQGETDAFDAPEFKEKKKSQPPEQTVLQEKAKAKEKIKAALSKTPETAGDLAQKKQIEAEKKFEVPKTVFGRKDFVKKDDLKYSLWKNDDLKQMTKLGRKDRSGLAQEFFPDRNFVRKEDVQKTIRGIEKGQIKPPKALGSGRIGRARATNVLRGMIGEKQKRVY